MDSLQITVMTIAAIIGVLLTIVYYFARYYLKIDHTDTELLTKKPIKIGLDEGTKAPTVEGALKSTQDQLWGRILRATFGDTKLPSAILNEIEDILYSSDLGPTTAERLVKSLSNQFSKSQATDIELVRKVLREEMEKTLVNSNLSEPDFFASVKSSQGPVVWMIVGINGAGKTTTIGKLASQAVSRGLKTMIVAADTFRAAADAQLKEWASRAGCEIYSPENVKDPSAVAFSALEMAKAKGFQLVIVDTAGRLHNQGHLMEELAKMKRVMDKILPGAPQERILVIDANAGQNALNQAREFHKMMTLTGVIATKMDGTAKGGVLLGIGHELNLPILFIGIGETVDSLKPFAVKEFVSAII